MELPPYFARNMRILRMVYSLSQKQISQDTGKAESTISEVLRGNYKVIGEEGLRTLVNSFGCDIDKLSNVDLARVCLEALDANEGEEIFESGAGI